tara:strand:+ start:1371 stop:2654 length:1284 start_codon:yes stop_codon:yes gene_type:complete
MFRKTILIIGIFISFNTSGQDKYGLDEERCKENLSMFREYYKQKNYVDALNPWRWAFINCPASSGNIYKNGPKIIKEKIKLDKENKSAYIDTLLMIFDQRVEYFGKKGYVLGLKGYELILLDKSKSEEALGYLEESIKIEEKNSSVQAVYGYMKAIVNLEKIGLKTKNDVLEAYDLISEIIDYNIINETKAKKNFVKYAQKIEDLFTPYANCEDLVLLYSNKIDTQTNDIDLLKRITQLLNNKECTDSDLFFNVTKRLYDLEPSSSSAYLLSKMSVSRDNSYEAIMYAKNAIEIEEDINIQAKYYLALADSYRSKGSFSLAREAVFNALEIRNGWGEAYINLGNIYIAGAKSCGNDFQNQTVYWIAIDAFKEALLDPETKLRASKSINTYSKYFPTKENCFFNGLTSGSNYFIECWINKNTIVRTSD